MARTELEDDLAELSGIEQIGQESSDAEPLGAQSHGRPNKWILKVR
jgi:hypothetical protein